MILYKVSVLASGSPIGKVDLSKIVVEDRTQKFNLTLTEDML